MEASSGEAYHYPTELLNLLIDAIPLLCRSKADVIQFFRAAGAPESLLRPWQQKLRTDKEAVKKSAVARSVLNDLNGSESNPLLRSRREIVKRVVEWSDFSACWESDRERAELLVRRIRDLVNAKDAFTRINHERKAAERKLRGERKERMEELTQKRAEKESAKAKLYAVFSEKDPRKRGVMLESALNHLFKAHGILVRESFVLRTEGGEILEQIDGAVEVASHLYLVEVKFRDSPVGVEEIARHLSRVQYRSGARGIFISVSPFTEPAIDTFRQAHQSRVHVALVFPHLVASLESQEPLHEFFQRRINAAILQKDPFA